ncbi:hypothetical protein FBR01_15375 [Anaerolineae bacterium CFX8]|nr:hypothetical protein [Anaerolineae bacterium CFX8]
MRQRWAIKLVLLVMLSLSALAVYAGSPHFIGSVRFSSGSLRAEGDLAGLGNENVIVRMDATATTLALCENPGGNLAPGRNPIYITQTVSDTAAPDRNGRAHIVLVAQDPTTIYPPPVSPTPKEAGCPNGKWRVVGLVPGSTHWTSARIQVIDNATGAVRWDQFYTCSGTDINLACIPS